MKCVTSKFKSSLESSWKEGIAAVVMISITDYYVIPMGLFLGASPQNIALLVAVPYLLASISQLLAVKIVDMIGSRLRFLVCGAIGQSVILGCVACLVFMRSASSVYYFIVLIMLFRTIGSLIATVWGSLMSDYLAPEERGCYLGWRSRITSIASIVGLGLGGLILFALKQGLAPIGFFVLFIVTAVARLVSALFMSRMQDIPLVHVQADHFTFVQFLRRFRESNFVKFVLYVASITFATQLAAPFFSVYMLRDLGFNYVQYMSIHLASVSAGILAMPLWGRHADVIGNAKVLKVTSFLIPAIPLLWTLTRAFPLLIIFELFAGFVWAGFNLCSVNFIFDAVSPGKRIRCLSYFGLINGAAVFLGANMGGVLLKHMPAVNGSVFCSLFLVSGILRFASHFFLNRKFHEVRAGARTLSSIKLFFSVVGLRPALGRNKEISMLIFDEER